MGKYCKDDLMMMGAGVHPLVFLDCLRSKREKLSPPCKARVFEEQVEVRRGGGRGARGAGW